MVTYNGKKFSDAGAMSKSKREIHTWIWSKKSNIIIIILAHMNSSVEHNVN